MKRFLAAMAFTASILSTGIGFAAEKTVTLAVENMFCPSCPYIVKKSLTRVTGVTKVKINYERKTAKVTYDDAKTNIEALMDATSVAGYPSEPAN